MMFKTHLMLALTVALLLLPYVEDKWLFVPLVLFSTLLPDIDSMHSFLGRKWFFRPLQWFVKHRGMLHSLTFCLLITGLFALFIPVLALGFFIGYGLHLFGDSLTVEGVRLWWPSKVENRGPMRTGGRVERGVLWVLTILSVIFVIRLFYVL